MSTTTSNNSSVAPASVVSQIAGIPSGISAPAPRTTGLAGGGRIRVVGHNGTVTASICSFLPPLFQNPPTPAASSSVLLESSALQSSGSPYGVPMAPLNRTTGFGNGQRAAQDTGHSVNHSRGTPYPLDPFSRSATASPPFSFSRASKVSNQCLQDGAAKHAEKVKYEKSRVKKADSAFPKKNRRKVKFAREPFVKPYKMKPGEKEFKLQAGHKFPGPTHLFNGEVPPQTIQKQIQDIGGSAAALIRCKNEVDSVIKELIKEEAERALKREIEEAKQREEQELADRQLALERGFIRVTPEPKLTGQADAAGITASESGWDIILYGTQEMLIDEPSPVSGDWDEAFDREILRMLEVQEAYFAGQKEQEAKAADIEALESVLNQGAVEAKAEDEGLATAESSWNLCVDDDDYPSLLDEPMPFPNHPDTSFELVEAKAENEGLSTAESGWNLSESSDDYPSLLDEPMPFPIPVVITHPDTSFELSDMSFQPSDDMPLLTETREPRCCAILENIPQWFVPGVTADDVELKKEELNGLIAQGIRPSATDEDCWTRMSRYRETPYLSSKEELYFEVPVELPFIRRFEAEFGDELMLTDVTFPDTVNSALETASADNTYIACDDSDIKLWSDRRLRAELEEIANSSLRAVEIEEADDSCF